MVSRSLYCCGHTRQGHGLYNFQNLYLSLVLCHVGRRVYWSKYDWESGAYESIIESVAYDGSNRTVFMRGSNWGQFQGIIFIEETLYYTDTR